MVHKCCNTTGTVGHRTDSSFLMHWFAALRQFVNALSQMSGINTLIHFEAGADVPLTRYTTGMALTSAGVCGGKVLRHVSSQQPGEKRRWYAPSPFCVSMSIVYQTTSSGLNAPSLMVSLGRWRLVYGTTDITVAVGEARFDHNVREERRDNGQISEMQTSFLQNCLGIIQNVCKVINLINLYE